MVTASGLLLSPLFVVIAERQGRFPQKGIFQAKNVYSVPNTTGLVGMIFNHEKESNFMLNKFQSTQLGFVSHWMFMFFACGKNSREK
uniref:Uncharacterized protein n=1 Tax=Globodera rostochiensis TaxID=31243 RepID=A0A914HR51_GLORO